MQAFEKEQPPRVGAPKAAKRNNSNTPDLAKKRNRGKRMFPEHLTSDQVRKAEDSIYRMLKPFLYDGPGSHYLMLRAIEIDRERDGSVRVETADIFDALWDVLEDQKENAPGRKEPR
jgi:hypothetical protein